MTKITTLQDVAIFLLRVATAVNFLSPVASRFGLWGKSNNWENFLVYTSQVNSFAPAWIIPFLAVAATVCELTIAILLLVGFKTRAAATSASVLTLLFGLAMTYSFGIKDPLDYAVFVDCTSAFLLATMPRYKWSIDERLADRRHGEPKTKNELSRI
jgi:uncharacterized membrane protein YphA (DoxX/SURF4 family)